MSEKIALAIRHVAFEDLGSIAGPLRQAGYRIEYLDASEDDLTAVDPLAADLLVVLGGPIGVYDEHIYPILATEKAILKQRMAANLPTVGICLGAQLMAAALGSRVYPGPEKEIGWSRLQLTPEGLDSPLCHLEDTTVLHWHGDSFDLPEGCQRLASTGVCANQAFSRGPNILGLQFHPEVIASRFENWLLGHAFELSVAKLDPRSLRAAASNHGQKLEQASDRMFADWSSRLLA